MENPFRLILLVAPKPVRTIVAGRRILKLGKGEESRVALSTQSTGHTS
jgi:hypothetical protein